MKVRKEIQHDVVRSWTWVDTVSDHWYFQSGKIGARTWNIGGRRLTYIHDNIHRPDYERCHR